MNREKLEKAVDVAAMIDFLESEIKDISGIDNIHSAFGRVQQCVGRSHNLPTGAHQDILNATVKYKEQILEILHVERERLQK